METRATIDAGFPATRIADLKTDAARVSGRVIAGRESMTAPLSGRACVYYQVRGTNHVRPWHDHFHYPPDGAAFEIDDGSGRIRVFVPPHRGGPAREDAAEEPFCTISGEPFRRTIYDGESPELDLLLDPGVFPFTRDAYLNAEERIVVAGDGVTVAGRVVEEISPEGTPQGYRSPPVRLVFRAERIRGERLG